MIRTAASVAGVVVLALAIPSPGAQTVVRAQDVQPAPSQQQVPAPPNDLNYYLELARQSFSQGQYAAAAQALADAQAFLARVQQGPGQMGPEQTLPTTPVRVGGDVRMPALLTRVSPVYPEEARAANIQGTVFIEAVIDTQGRVTNAQVVRSVAPSIDAAALDAVQRWSYARTFLGGQPVPVILTITMSFSLK